MREIRDRKIEAMRRVDLLRGLPHEAVVAVARAADLVEAPGGSLLERRGDRPARWWIVLDGLVVLDAPGATTLAGRGDTWGAPAALGHRPAPATATAFDAVTALVVDAPRVAALLRTVPELAIGLLRSGHPRPAAPAFSRRR